MSERPIVQGGGFGWAQIGASQPDPPFSASRQEVVIS